MARSNLVILAFLQEKVKTVNFSETIAASDLKQMDLMKICKYRRSRSFFDLGPRLCTYKNSNQIFSETTVLI